MKIFFLILFLATNIALCAAPQILKRDLTGRIIFQNPEIKTHYSPLMQEKNSRADSLLPALNGDVALSELLRLNPTLWSMEALDKHWKLLTKVKVDIFYIDGTREEAFCDFSKTASANNWELAIGVDFVSGSSNTVGIHVQQCINMVRDSIGFAIQDSLGKVLAIPPKKVLQEIEKNKIPEVIPIDLQMRLLKAHQGVELTGECPADIEAYAILLDVWKRVKTIEMDIPVISDLLGKSESVQSCAFNREWNRRYNETATFQCNINDVCEYNQSQDGKTLWQWNTYDNRLEFIRKKFLFFPYGKKSIHSGGTMLDLRITPLSTRLFLESYLDLNGDPISLGLIILGKE